MLFVLGSAAMRIEVNGEARNVAEGSTVGELLQTLGLGSGPIAVERNRVLVPRAEHAATRLAEGDQLEIVQFVGGG
jgi:sulfur carrier protein